METIEKGDMVRVVETIKGKDKTLTIGRVREVNSTGAWIGIEWLPFRSRLLNMRIVAKARKAFGYKKNYREARFGQRMVQA